MKDLRSKIAITLVCAILGIILAIQFKTVTKTVGDGMIPTQRAQQLAIELKRLQDERESLRKELESLEGKVRQYEKGEAEKDFIVENLYRDLERFRMIAGYEEVKGPGVVIEIDDPELEVQFGDTSSAIVSNYEFILQIVSILNAAEAEAISINEQRFTSYTEIEPAANHLEINGVSFGPPFVIKAIGNPDLIESALRIKGGFVHSIQQYFDLSIQIRQEPELIIPKYRRIHEFRYAKPIDAISGS